MSLKTNNVMVLLVIVVSTVWMAVLLVPLFTKVNVQGQTQVGVHAAMMLILGAYFGISIVRKNDGGGKDG